MYGLLETIETIKSDVNFKTTENNNVQNHS